MSAETLRKAAALMRERAEAATPGPWRPQGDEIRATSADSLIPDNILVGYASAHYQRLGMKKTGRGNPVPEHAPDVLHAASWHPAVALLAADLLDRLADDRELDPYLPKHFDEAAVEFARAYLGEAS